MKLKLVQSPKSKKSHDYSQGKFDPAHPLVTQSWLKLHNTCAFAAFMRFIEGIKDPPNAHATIGISVDAGITFGADTQIKTGQDATLSDKLEIAAREFDKRKKETRFFMDLSAVRSREIALEMVELHHTEIAPRLKPVETQVSVRVDFATYSIAGKIDLVEENDVISESKTANRRGKHFIPLSAQPAHYSLLYMHKYGRKPSAFRHYVMLKTKARAVECIEGKVTAHDQEVHHYRIKAAISEMQNSIKTDLFRLAEQDHWKCHASGKWCPYLYKGCPKGNGIRKGVKK